MDYKKFCKIFSICAIFIIISFLGLAVVVDPLGIIGSPVIKGFNHYKSKQDVYEYVWKPYLAADCKADVIIIGSSRVRIGWKASLEGFTENQVFNFGLSSLPLPKMQKHLEMIYNVHCPKVLLIGIDFFQFGKGNYDSKMEGYSVERLDTIAGCDIVSTKMLAIKDTMSIGKLAFLATIKDSIINRDKNNQYIHGFDTKRGNTSFVEDEALFNLFKKSTYGNFKYEPKAIETLKKIVELAKNKKIKVYVFVNPISKKLCDLLCSYGHENEWKEIKKKIAGFTGKVYELKNAEKYISDNSYFYDFSHCNVKLSEILKAEILADN